MAVTIAARDAPKVRRFHMLLIANLLYGRVLGSLRRKHATAPAEPVKGRARLRCCPELAVGSLLRTSGEKILREERHGRFQWRTTMVISKAIAGLIGPTFVAIAAALLLNLGSISAVLEPLSRDPALVLIYGMLLFIAGLAIVRVHNRWAADWSILVTILGWLLIVGGLVRMLFPLRLAAMAGDFAQNAGVMAVVAVLLLAIGAFLSFKAYASS
jgi:hypothetical protein